MAAVAIPDAPAPIMMNLGDVSSAKEELKTWKEQGRLMLWYLLIHYKLNRKQDSDPNERTHFSGKSFSKCKFFFVAKTLRVKVLVPISILNLWQGHCVIKKLIEGKLLRRTVSQRLKNHEVIREMTRTIENYSIDVTFTPNISISFTAFGMFIS